MSSVMDPAEGWERVAAELRACKESQQQAWATWTTPPWAATWPAGLSGDEHRQLEATLAELPELRKLTDLVQDVLRDLGPIEELPPIPFPTPAACRCQRLPHSWPFLRHGSGRAWRAAPPGTLRWRRRLAC